MEQLRQILMDYYGTAMYNGNPMAIMKLTEVEHASLPKLIEMAREIGIDVQL